MSKLEKVPCLECRALILPGTAEKNHGLCMPCKSGTRASMDKKKQELERAKEAPPEPEFICLECGFKKWRTEMNAHTVMNPEDPWSMVASRVECWDCGTVMPRALARRWNVGLEEAKDIWREKFRSDKRSRVKNA